MPPSVGGRAGRRRGGAAREAAERLDAHVAFSAPSGGRVAVDPTPSPAALSTCRSPSTGSSAIVAGLPSTGSSAIVKALPSTGSSAIVSRFRRPARRWPSRRPPSITARRSSRRRRAASAGLCRRRHGASAGSAAASTAGSPPVDDALLRPPPRHRPAPPRAGDGLGAGRGLSDVRLRPDLRSFTESAMSSMPICERMSDVADLNSRSVRPSCRPISGSRLGPKTTRAMMRTMTSSGSPMLGT